MMGAGEFRFFLGHVIAEDGHLDQFLIPVRHRQEWEDWCLQSDDTPVPRYAVPLEGGLITFSNPKCE